MDGAVQLLICKRPNNHRYDEMEFQHKLYTIFLYFMFCAMMNKFYMHILFLFVLCNKLALATFVHLIIYYICSRTIYTVYIQRG